LRQPAASQGGPDVTRDGEDDRSASVLVGPGHRTPSLQATGGRQAACRYSSGWRMISLQPSFTHRTTHARPASIVTLCLAPPPSSPPPPPSPSPPSIVTVGRQPSSARARVESITYAASCPRRSPTVT